MTIHNHEVLFILAAFVLGGLVGPLLWTLLKTWSAKELTAVENKFTGSKTGPSGATGA